MKNHLNLLKYIFVLLTLTVGACSGQTAQNQNQRTASTNQNKIVGGGCDGCELMFVGMPKEIESVDYSPGWTEKGQKLLVAGIVYKLDGQTPAPNVIIYYWQTDSNGYYSPKPEMDERAKRHGHIRGWVKSDENGKYSIYTIRPAPYPNRDIPAHIHLSIKEPNIANEYYIDEFVFDDDKLLIPAVKKNPSENRGGSGVLRVLLKDDLQIAEHNIILGLNIPNYPEIVKSEKQSGLAIGEDNPSFTPFHAWGADKGTRACPVCKYGRYHGILYFVGNNPNWDEIKKWLVFLEQESVTRGKHLKTYFVYGNESDYDKDERQKTLQTVGQELDLKNVALTFVPSFQDSESNVNLNKINPNLENTIVVFRQRNIIAKYIDLKPSTENFKDISTALDRSTSEYFNLQEL
ncbi:MAG: intradiol ring-cleavage dioxygenase [Pyrinomonadaceae bacterium]